MKLFKRISTLALATIVASSLVFNVFAKPQSIYAPQTDADGIPFQALQLGDWVVDTQGNYSFKYSVNPFKNQNARDKGLIPYAQQGKYENPSKWAEYEVIKAAKMGLSNMDFITQYQDDVTRGEFARAIVQAYYKYDEWLDGNKEVATDIETDIFADIDVEENPDDLAIIHAYYLGIVQGWGGEYHSDELISRQDMATIIGRFCELYDINLLTNKDLKNYYADHKEIRSYAKKYVAGLSNDKIFKGYPIPENSDIGKDEVSNYIFNPVTNTTNEQALVLILRTCEKYLDPQVSHIIGTSINVDVDKTKLTWNAVYGADTYEVLGRKWVSDTVAELYSGTMTHSENLELETYDKDGYPTCALGSGVYDFSVIPYNEMDAGLESNKLRIVVPHPVEKASVKITDNGNGTAKLEWDNVAHFNVAGGDDDKGATKYRVVIKENGTNKVLEDKFVNEVSGDPEVTSMTLNEPLVNNIGTFKVIIYAYNNDFASAPVTAEYKVSEQTIDVVVDGEFEQIQDTVEIEVPDGVSHSDGEYPLYQRDDNDVQFYRVGNDYFRVSDSNAASQNAIDHLEPVMVDDENNPVTEEETSLVIEQI